MTLLVDNSDPHVFGVYDIMIGQAARNFTVSYKKFWNVSASFTFIVSKFNPDFPLDLVAQMPCFV